MRLARLGTGTTAEIRWLHCRHAALFEALRAAALRFDNCAEFLHLMAQHADLLAQFFQPLRPAPGLLRHRAELAKAAACFRTIAGLRAMDFGRLAAVPVAGSASRRVRPVPRRSDWSRFRAPIVVASNLGPGLPRVRKARSRTRGLGIRPAALGVFAGRLVGPASRLVW